MSAEFDQLVAEFEKFQSKIKQVDDRFANLGQLRSEIASLEATATSPDRSITVVAGPGGAIKDIQFTQQALGQQPQALSSALLTTLQQAVAEAARKQAGLVDEHLGDDTQLSEQVLQAQAELFGTSVEELRSQHGDDVRRPTAEEEYHDDYSQRTVLSSGTDGSTQGPPPGAGGGSAGEAFLQNLFNEEDR
ncbi:hypothetical protein SacmaDRAFT_0686 [Saccharomonospora marina XMU15]|uniref:YbaB/EbfC DNA-binding family protein n=1 Tax=Saccharomonospora marina XMU15 TaxID=882083 RepID=H5X697_9PSEU|nr:YbaB/EbfC family nucleoid-associated protein [Saccharomonospora marina]EHR48982.1 hypothetical protein SacmaDRAFT_0686 [Saccharomonospora marina XMU15]